jgi:hypothetical protein
MPVEFTDEELDMLIEGLRCVQDEYEYSLGDDDMVHYDRLIDKLGEMKKNP